jgi:D-threonate/D-erythronate kinase
LNILALADDATGALEIGARFGEAGIDSRVCFDLDAAWSGDAVVIDTETRPLSREHAAAVIRSIAMRAKQEGVAHIYKKTDSTLRGPIAAEFRALLDVWPELPLVYAPAYPALGRTVRAGELHVDGRPLSETAFAADLLNPSGESSIAKSLHATAAEVFPVRSADDIHPLLAPGRILVCDGETDRDLQDVAAAIDGTPCLLAGTAAMAAAWATRLTGGSRRNWTPASPVRTCLVVNGSLHPASRAQLAISGIPMLAHDPTLHPSDTGKRLAAWIGAHRWASLCAGPRCSADPLAVASHAAQVVGHTVRESAPDGLIVFGGATVFAILRELNISEAEPHVEILPGAPASTVRSPDMMLVTKAGGFGAPDYLLRIRGILEKE